MNKPQAVSVAHTAIFLWQGFMDVVGSTDARSPERQALYDKHIAGLGQDGFAFSISMIAEILEEEYNNNWANPRLEFPGVYHYEIIEPIGSWLVHQDLLGLQYGVDSSAPVKQLLRAHYNEVMAAWLVTAKLTK